MSSKHSGSSRMAASPSSPSQHGSKLPKFLQKQNRDRSKSMTDPTGGGGSSASIASSSSASSSSTPPPLPEQPTKQRGKSSKLSGVKEREEAHRQDTEEVDEPPVIIEPPSSRTRTRSERPLSSVSDIHPALYSTNGSSARISDLPTRLSGWFSHTFSTSSTDLSLPSLMSQQQQANASISPKGKSSAMFTAVRHGKGHLDKAVRYLLDSDSTPDKCTDPIWLLGLQHPGYEAPPPPVSSSASSITPTPSGRRSSVDSLVRRSPSSFRSSSSSSSQNELSQSQPPSSRGDPRHPGANWPPVFYADFTSLIWLTYRSQFQPIRDSALSALDSDPGTEPQSQGGSPQQKRWNWPIGGEKGWTSDAGWGCMLRTGQSLLANALVHMHLGRDWRRPPHPVHTADYATYVQIITWFLDTPSPQAPFGVHRMALAGKELGKDVGQWFGPSTAAGAIKTLVHAFPEANLGVSVASDSVVYQNDIYAASQPDDSGIPGSPRGRPARWGGRAVLVLVGIRLGINGVNPFYYEPIKTLFTFPQSVGIAGGRPSSSYYFVGSQADNLFYLDPHHARPAVPLRPPPTPPHNRQFERETTPENDRRASQRSPPPTNHHRSPTSPSSTRTGSSTFSYHTPISPSPLQQQFSTSSSSTTSSSLSSSQLHSSTHGRWASVSPGVSSEMMDTREFGAVAHADLDPLQEHYVNAYSAAELKTFHCDRVRKMPLSGLDPSMLLGFLCKDEADWLDLRKRVADLSKAYKPIFSIQDEPPHWPSDSSDDIGLESMSDDMDMPEDDEDEGDGEHGDFFDTRSPSTSPDTSVKGKGSEVDTEEDPMGPITPGPHSRSTFDVGEPQKEDEQIDEFGDDDDWVDPSVPTPIAERKSTLPPPPSNGSTGKKSGKKTKKGAVPVRFPSQDEPHFPFPVTPGTPAREPERRSASPEAPPSTGNRMHTARARDGGRTQSGGVRGVLTVDDGEAS
ncbi:hypothetical protein PLICRDRAFT_702172 [Plicaturopsis crispa FD-325 SS-3]|uniref:Cysteine protease n=1 Tax=Plicaturopsis crispa FD-325 SS-3 TaxID=944288 RepID=A0A0C9T3J2_PLICR|nr:hypothetical protein PLICRDRAFT_702172 [Plicaturopsis crispa FD-325 SS-3]